MRSIVVASFLILSTISYPLFGQGQAGQQGGGDGKSLSNGAASSPQVGEQVMQVFRDAWGREMERVRITRSVPIQSYQLKDLKETRVVQEWTYENRPTTQYQVTPSTQYQLQSKIVGRWNPFVQPRVVAEYAPVTQYQRIPSTVNVPMAVPKYTTREFTRQVWDLVPSTRLEQFEIIRPKSTSTNGIATTGVQPPDMNRTNMPQSAAQLANMQRTSSTPSPYPLTPIGASYSAPIVNPPAIPLGSLAVKPLIDPRSWFGGGQSSSRPYQAPLYPTTMNQTPVYQASNSQAVSNNLSWNSRQPIFSTSPLAMGRWNPPSASSPYLRPTTNSVLPNASLPQTASLQGYGSMRDPMQSGFQPTELR